MTNQPENPEVPEINDLTVESESYSTPGAGELGGDAGDGADDGAITYGTTCWGTPCPSNNTVSC